MTNPAAKFATPRVTAGALFVDDGQVLMVHKTYGNGWDIPGGYVDIGESPADACHRELLEELGLERPARRLLAIDWAPNDGEGDKILYVFDCGEVGDTSQIDLFAPNSPVTHARVVRDILNSPAGEAQS